MKGDIELRNRRDSPDNSKEITLWLGRTLTAVMLYQLCKLN